MEVLLLRSGRLGLRSIRRDRSKKHGEFASDAAEFVGLIQSLSSFTEDQRAGWYDQSRALNIPKADLTLARAFVERDARLFD